jgi:hypothetical protein
MTKKTIINGTVVLTLTVAFAGFGALRLTPAASAQAGPSGEQKTFTGKISDSMCGAMHMAKDKTPAECTHMCIKDGQKYALVADMHVYTLEGREAELDKFAAHKVTVRGTLNGNTLSVASVALAVKEKTPSTPPGN